MMGERTGYSVARTVVFVLLVAAAAGLALSAPATAEETVDDDQAGTTAPDLEITSVEAPEEIGIDETLEVAYTVENVGDELGEETFVDLYAKESIVATDTDLVVPANDSVSGTLAFDGVYGLYDPGDTIEFTVELADFGDAVAGQTEIADSADPPDTPDLQIASIDYPEKVGETDDFVVEYTVANVGEAAGTETFVDLIIDGVGLVDWEENLTVPPGETATGTLLFSTVEDTFELGDVISFEVALYDFYDSATGETSVEQTGDLQLAGVEYPGEIGVNDTFEATYTVENVGEAAATESAIGLLVGESEEDATPVDSHENVTVPAGESVSDTLVFDSVADQFEAGGSFNFGIGLLDFGDRVINEVDIEEGVTSGPNLGLAGVDAPDELGPAESLEVTYTIENVGDEAGTESAVALLVEGQQVDTHGNVTVSPGETTSGTLVYDSAGEAFEDGETLTYTVELSEFGDSTGGETSSEGQGSSGADFEIESLNAPDEIAVDESLTVNYTVRNVGNTSGTESQVSLVVGNDSVDADQSVSLLPNESENGTLVFDSVDEQFSDGDTIVFSVELSTFGDSASETTIVESTGADFDIESVDAPGEIAVNETLEVTYTIENVGNDTGTEESVSLLVDGETVDSDDIVTLVAGSTTSGTLVYESVSEAFQEGDTIPFSLELTTFGESTNGTTNIAESDESAGGADIQIESVSVPDEISVDDVLPVSYTIENTGNESGTESQVSLVVGNDTADSDQNVTVASGDTREGVLILDNVADQFDPGDVIGFSVELSTFDDSSSGSTDIESDNGGDGGDDNGTGTADLQLSSVEAPEIVGPDEDLTVNYTIQNVGNETATESFVDLNINGALVASDQDVTVDPGETVSGTLSRSSTSYDEGETLEYAVELADFGDRVDGEIFVGTLEKSGTVSIEGAVATDSVTVSVNVVSLETLDETGWLAVENLDNSGQVRTTPVQDGEFEIVSLEDIGGVSLGDTIEVRLATDSGFTEVLDTDSVTVEAGENTPIASFEWSPGVPQVGQPVSFNGGNSRGEGGSIVEYRWDFDNDGEFEEVTEFPTVQYSFETAGSQTVRLVVENEVGLTTEETSQVSVQEPPDPPEAALSVLNIAKQGSTATIEPEASDVSVTVTNVGDQSGSFQVTLTVGSAFAETLTTSQLGADGEDRLVFDDATENLNPGTYNVTVSTEDGTIRGELTVESQPDPESAFAVSSVETNSPVSTGENLTVTAEIENTGDGDGVATVALDAGPLGTDTASVNLDSGDSANATFTLGAGDDAGAYNVTASVGDSERSVAVTVEGGGGGSGGIAILLFLFALVLLVVGGAYYYYVYDEEASTGGMDSL
jgi:subtilase family serine protease